ncbi:peptidoglycan-binding protein [Tepidimonas taiwanensis]|uniref:His-Xaa-Ser repeat protein HxsA n=1 Tax=Tepidimonas taiwanensis TaxID=307486 RepID=A0A554X0P7_9BURK|nr:peptidoglycan-binding protein [Tepidimonas taiwanensis]TSE29393.1 His-Xaa-Ser repeat protein HxsA [Tepidimonas taiwanensis]UBQ04750.1 peptidoglycan-binding protein [Tepidimonas taiwanensis]
MRLQVLGTAAVLAMGLAGCVATAPKIGDDGAKTAVTGAAGGASAQNANSQIERCDRPFGTVALVENQESPWFLTLREYKLGSTIPVLRLLVQQSNCFIVVERGRAMNNMNTERQLQQSGELRQGSNFGKGQMVAADYSITPEIIFDQKGTQNIGAAIGGWAGLIAGGLRRNEASTVLLLTDNRSGVQVSAAEGSSSNTDFSLGGFAVGGGLGAGMGGYSNTPQGKVIVAAFVNAYNQMIQALRNYTAQSMGDRGLGTGGRLQVDGAPAAEPSSSNTSRTTPSSGMSLLDAQRKLAQLGYDVGTPDGKMGNRTRQALRSFQASRGLPQSGQLDAATQAELAK